MARPTIAGLTAELETAQAEIQTLRTENASLTAAAGRTTEAEARADRAESLAESLSKENQGFKLQIDVLSDVVTKGLNFGLAFSRMAILEDEGHI